jgi:coenzyme F420 biosynthesis associated uncharacterized protein
VTPSAVDWSLAERVAVRVAGREPFADSYHAQSLVPDFEQFTVIAEDLVAECTGLRSAAGPARARVTDRSGWVRANVASFQRLLRPVLDRFSATAGSGPFAPFTSRVTGAELGVMLGWMSTRVLGQYDLLVIEDENPEDQDLVYYVGPNVLALERRFAFPPSEFRLWLALHEVTHRAQFTGVPWMRGYFLGLVEQTVSAVGPDPARFAAAVGRAAESLRQGRNPLADGGVMALVATDDQREVLDRMSGLMSLLEGHGDVTMDRAGADRIPSAARFSRVLRQRRQQSQGLARILQQLIGLEAKLAQYEQGEKFIAAVERQDPVLIDRVWADPGLLPTLVEIRDPDAWLSRIGAGATNA